MTGTERQALLVALTNESNRRYLALQELPADDHDARRRAKIEITEIDDLWVKVRDEKIN